MSICRCKCILYSIGKTACESYDVRTTSPLSDQISKDSKKRGIKFVDSTVIYSFLQAIGIINGHGPECDLCGTSR